MVPNRIRTRLGAAAALGALALAGPGGLQGQGHPSAVGPQEIRHIQSLSPRSGPPGTEVSVSTLNLPFEARVYVGIGAQRAGFEVLTEAEQGRWGEIAVRTRVPAGTSHERPIVFIAFNAVFAPIGMSDPFHVTDGEGRVRRSGRVVDGDAGCLLLEDQDGYRYELTGTTDGLERDGRIELEGVYFEDGPCTGGPTLGVTRVLR